jgi:hypothetical protein
MEMSAADLKKAGEENSSTTNFINSTRIKVVIILSRLQAFSIFQNVQTSSRAHTASYFSP